MCVYIVYLALLSTKLKNFYKKQFFKLFLYEINCNSYAADATTINQLIYKVKMKFPLLVMLYYEPRRMALSSSCRSTIS